jgi:RNA polymerase sigma-70 factor (ECF subfamily)
MPCREVTVEAGAHRLSRTRAGTVGDHGPWSHARLDAVKPESGSPAARLLLQQIHTGDQRALAEFVRLHERQVSSLVSRVLDDPQDVLEVTQDTFVRVWRHAGAFRGEAAVATWVHRIAMNEALMRVRRKHRPQTTLDVADAMHVADEVDAPADTAARTERIRAVRAALASLPLDQRAAVGLRDLERYSSAEAAAILGIAEPTLKTRLHRGRMRLRVLLADLREDGE